MTDSVYISRQGEMVDWICWRFYGRQAVAVEAVLAANEGLADYGAVLPEGVAIRMPRLSVPSLPIVRLWD